MRWNDIFTEEKLWTNIRNWEEGIYMRFVKMIECTWPNEIQRMNQLYLQVSDLGNYMNGNTNVRFKEHKRFNIFIIEEVGISVLS